MIEIKDPAVPFPDLILMRSSYGDLLHGKHTGLDSHEFERFFQFHRLLELKVVKKTMRSMW